MKLMMVTAGLVKPSSGDVETKVQSEPQPEPKPVPLTQVKPPTKTNAVPQEEVEEEEVGGDLRKVGTVVNSVTNKKEYMKLARARYWRRNDEIIFGWKEGLLKFYSFQFYLLSGC